MITVRLLRHAAVAIAVLAVLVLTGCYVAARWRPSVAQFPIQGIDVDQRAGPIDWPMVKAEGADFAYLRATAGAEQRDTRFEQYWNALPTSGLRRGAWHGWSLCRLATDQAANFVSTVPRSTDALPAVLALDFTPECSALPEREVLLTELTLFIRIVENHTGKPMMLRITSAFESRYRVTDAINRPLWSKQMFFVPDYATRGWRMWQANPARRIAGVAGPVGWNVVRP